MSESSSDEDEGLSWDETLECIKRNDPRVKAIEPIRWLIEDITDEEWEELGHAISNNTYLTDLYLWFGVLNDHRMSCLFRGLTRSSSAENMRLSHNELSVAGVRSMVPFLQTANNLYSLKLAGTNLQSEGFNMIFRALRDSPIKWLDCNTCRIKTIDIDIDHAPRNLSRVLLPRNSINADGCRELVKLLQGGGATLNVIDLDNNEIGDDGVEILVNTLQNNTSMRGLDLQGNRISSRGRMMLLKLVNDISSIEATLRSNHTLTRLEVRRDYLDREDDEIQTLINNALTINYMNRHNPGSVGREKLIRAQLYSKRRAELAELQGVSQSVYSEINPLHLPEVLALVGQRNGQGELYLALKSSIAELMSTVNEDAELAAIVAKRGAALVESESSSIKKRRAC